MVTVSKHCINGYCDMRPEFGNRILEGPFPRLDQISNRFRPLSGILGQAGLLKSPIRRRGLAKV